MYASVTVRRRDVSASRLLYAHALSSATLSVASLNVAARAQVFVKPGTKSDDDYYRDEHCLMELLLAIRSIAVEVNIFQQDNAPAHRARQTAELLRHETLEFTAPDM